MKLYCVEVAPNPTKVRLYIAEKIAAGGSMLIEEVRVKLMKGEQKLPEHLRRTPFGTLPVLEISAGDCIIESLSIMDYLEERYPEPNMLGGSPRERTQTRELERIAELRVLQPIASMIHATNSPIGLAPSADVAEQARDALKVGLQYVDDCLSDGRDFVVGDNVTMADCTLAAGLQFARFAKLEVDTGLTHLQRWDIAYRKRDAAQAVLLF